MSPAVCLGGKLCRIGRSGSVTTGSPEAMVGAGVAVAAGSNLPKPSGTFGVGSGFIAGGGDNWNGILMGGAGAEGGTGGPLEAGTRGNAGSPVPFGKTGFSAGAAGLTKGMRGVEPSRLGSIPMRGGEILGGGVSGIFTAGDGGTG